MNDEKNSTNVKSFVIAFILTVITWSLTVNGTFINIFAVIIFAFIAFVIFLIYFFIVRKLFNAFIKNEKIYPTFVFRILFPFFIFLCVSFIIYGLYNIKPFIDQNYFIEKMMQFIVKVMPSTVIFSILTGLILSISEKKSTEKEENVIQLKNNKLWLGYFVLFFVTMIFLFYFQNR
jgi:hypothetical protein